MYGSIVVIAGCLFNCRKFLLKQGCIDDGFNLRLKTVTTLFCVYKFDILERMNFLQQLTQTEDVEFQRTQRIITVFPKQLHQKISGDVILILQDQNFQQAERLAGQIIPHIEHFSTIFNRKAVKQVDIHFTAVHEIPPHLICIIAAK